MKLISTTLYRFSLVVATLITALSITSQVSAVDPVQCKGLDSEACISQDSCSWVKGYERKDGKMVNAFCRSKAKQKATSATSVETSDKTS